jgi:hypothetical protein
VKKTMLTTLLILGLTGVVQAKMIPDPVSLEISYISNSKQLTIAEKTEKLIPFFTKVQNPNAVLYYIARHDKSTARKIAIEIFRRPTTPRIDKLCLGQFLYRIRYTEKNPMPDKLAAFVPEYRNFLINAILKGGNAEFNRTKTSTPTAIGEYACIAGGIGGTRGIPFSAVADKRVIPVLITALSAPDNIYPVEQGCLVRGKPGESTGRNTQRQGVPLALAKLNAVSAIPALKNIVANHHDYNLRSNAAYALGYLSNSNNVKILETSVKNGANKYLLYHFGKGLVAQGDYDGIKYLVFEYSIYEKHQSFQSVAYMLKLRLKLVSGIQDKRIAEFYKHVLNFAPLRSFFYLDADGMENMLGKVLNSKKRQKRIAENQQYINRYKANIISLYQELINGLMFNKLHQFDKAIEDIRNKTQSPEIRAISNTYIKH